MAKIRIKSENLSLSSGLFFNPEAIFALLSPTIVSIFRTNIVYFCLSPLNCNLHVTLKNKKTPAAAFLQWLEFFSIKYMIRLCISS